MGNALRLHKLADKSGHARPPYPLAGVQIVGDPPVRPAPSTKIIDGGVAEGWITRVNERAVIRPAGPRHAPLSSTHSFVHCDAVVFRTVDGDIRYRVTGQPDKYGPDGSPVESYEGIDDLTACDVRRFYQLELDED